VRLRAKNGINGFNVRNEFFRSIHMKYRIEETIMSKKILILLILTCLSVASFAKTWQLDKNSVICFNNKIIDARFAAEELQKHLALVLGKQLEIKSCVAIPANLSPDSLNWVIGFTCPGDNKPLAKTEARYAVRDNIIYFYGDHNLNDALENRVPQSGLLMAIYTFLENKLNIHWIRPGDAGIVYTTMTNLDLPGQEDVAWNMPFEMIGVRVYAWSPDRVMPMNKLAPGPLQYNEKEMNVRLRNDLIWANRLRQGSRTVITYGHAFTGWWDKYGKTNPEFFGLSTEGVRGLKDEMKGRVKLCVSNEAVVDKIIEEWVASGKPEYYNICPNDGTPGFCFCQECMKLDARKDGEDFYAHLTDRYLNFWNRIAAKAVKLRPDVTLITYIYSYYRFPPRREKVAYPDNMLFGMVPSIFDDNETFFDEWAKAGAKSVFLRPNDLYELLPFFRGAEKLIYDKFQQSRRFKLFGTDYDGLRSMRTIDIDYYIIARAMTSPDKSFDELENEYCSAYGAAAPLVKQFYQLYRDNGDKNRNAAKEIIKNKKLRILDDSMISILVSSDLARGMNRNAIVNAGEILKKGKSLKLEPRHAAALDDLILLNQHALLSYDFMTEVNKKQQGQPNDLENTAKKLTEFRIKNRDAIGICWPVLFGHGERKSWKEVDWYKQEVMKNKITEKK